MSNCQEFQVVETRKSKRLARKILASEPPRNKVVTGRLSVANPQIIPSQQSTRNNGSINVQANSSCGRALTTLPPFERKTETKSKITFTISAPGPRPMPRKIDNVVHDVNAKLQGSTRTVEEKKATRDAHVAKVRQTVFKKMLDEKRPSFVPTKEHPTIEAYVQNSDIFTRYLDKRLQAALKKEKIDRAIRNGKTVTCEQCQFGMEGIDEENYKKKKLCGDCHKYWKEQADEDDAYWSQHYAWLDSMQRKEDDYDFDSCVCCLDEYF